MYSQYMLCYNTADSIFLSTIGLDIWVKGAGLANPGFCKPNGNDHAIISEYTSIDMLGLYRDMYMYIYRLNISIYVHIRIHVYIYV